MNNVKDNSMLVLYYIGLIHYSVNSFLFFLNLIFIRLVSYILNIFSIFLFYFTWY